MSYARRPGGIQDRCSRCDAPFAEGGLRYRVHIHVTAENGEGQEFGELEQELEELKEIIAGKKPEEVREKLRASVQFILCDTCRDEFLDAPETPLSTFFFGI